MNISKLGAEVTLRFGCHALLATFCVMLLILTPVAPVVGAPLQGENAQQRSELGARQQLVARRMAELESTLTQIANKIEEEEPERAKRLIKAFQQAKEQLITQNMTDVIELLDQEEYAQADEKLLVVIENIDQLISMLINQKQKELTPEEEMANLEAAKAELIKIGAEENELARETNKVANKDQTLENLEAQLKALDGIIEDQQRVLDETSQKDGEGMRAMDRVADKQFDVRNKTEDLAESVKGNTAPKSENKPGEGEGEGKPGEGEAKPGEGEAKPGEGEAKPGEGEAKPGEGEAKPDEGEAKPGEGEAKPGEGKPGEGKPAEGKPGEGKPGEGKPGEGKPGEGQPGEGQQQQQPPQPGQAPLERAAEHQRKAEEKLGSGKAKDANREQEKAIDDLKDARAELEKERRRIESLPPEAFKQMAEEQRRTRDKAMDLVEKLKKMPPKNQDGGEPGQSPQPGQQSTEQAAQSMQQAAENLEEGDLQQAERQQQQAQEQIAKAIEEIEDRLNQLREETREEKLARLESRFREMLDRQKIASIITIELEDKRHSMKELRRRDQLVLIRTGTEEFEISELGRQAYDLLLEDGTSIVFPEIVQALQEDLQRIGKLMQDDRTDQLIQLLQRDIEATLLELLDALKEIKKKSEGGGGGGGGGGGDQPLLRSSAELKMLKARQTRINRITKRLEEMQVDRPLDEELEHEFQRGSAQQQDLRDMIERINEKAAGN